jgi:hypothetical protein
MQRFAVTLVAVLTLLVAAPAPAATTTIRIARCDMTVDIFQGERTAVRKALPRRFTPLPFGVTSPEDVVDSAAGVGVSVWVLDCARFGTARRTVLSLVGILVRNPSRRYATPNRYHQFLVWANTGNADAAAALTAAGIEATVPETMRHTDAGPVVTRVRGPEPSFTLSAPRYRTLDQPHDHRNRWWQGSTRMDLRIDDANDRLCATRLCTRITTPEGSPLAALLGNVSSRARTSFQHLPLSGTLRIVD